MNAHLHLRKARTLLAAAVLAAVTVTCFGSVTPVSGHHGSAGKEYSTPLTKEYKVSPTGKEW